MNQKLNFIFWTFLIAGVCGLILPGFGELPMFSSVFKTASQLYLFCFTGFLVLKQIFFYRVKENNNVIRLIRKSEFQNNFLMQGIAISVLCMIYVYQTETLVSFSTIMTAILLFYYVVQVVIHGNPSIYLDDESFSYDDYFVEVWPWKSLNKIEVENEELRLIGNEKDFVLDFELIDDFDFVRINDEVDHNILDGHFASDKSSKKLLDVVEGYAQNYGIKYVA